MRKDRFLFAIIIYGLILLAGAGVCCAMLPEEISAVANAGAQAGTDITPTQEGIVPTPTEPALQPGQSTDAMHKDNDASEHQKLPEQGKQDEMQPGKTVNGGDVSGEEEEMPTGAWALLSVKTTAEWREIIGDRCIVLPKPEQAEDGQALVFSLTQMPMEQSIGLRVQGCKQTGYGYESVERIAGEQYFVSEPLLTSDEETDDPLRKMTASCTLQEDGSYEVYVELLLDKTYAYNVYETEKHYFIALREAKSVYDSIVVLDAGHGGWDTGTLSADGKGYEKNINLQVLLYLEEMLTARRFKVYTTRTTDRYIGHRERIALANALEADMFISIHCSNVDQDAEANGTEVLYAEQELAGSTKLKAKALARICAEKLTEMMPSENGVVWVPDEEVTVLQEAEVPAVQVELDMELLQTEEGQKAAAQALCDAVMDAYHSTLPE